MDRIARRGSITLLLIFVLIIQGRTLRSGLLKNLAVLQLLLPWQEQQAQYFDPPCERVGDFEPAIGNLHTVLTESQEDTHALSHLGRLTWLTGECDAAVELWEAAAREDTGAAFELFRVGDFNSISAPMRETISSFAHSKAARIQRSGEKELAHLWYARSFDLRPRHETADYFVQLYNEAGDTAAVERLWRGMVETLPATDAEHWWARAELYLLERDWALAAEAFQNGASLSPDSYDYWMEAGKAWEEAGNSGKAVNAYNEAIQTHPDRRSPYLRIGIVIKAQGKYSEALNWFLAAQEISSDGFSLKFQLAECLFYLGDYQAAKQYFQEALKIDPDHTKSRSYLGEIERLEGHPIR